MSQDSSNTTNTSVVHLQGVEDRASRRQIGEMADIYKLGEEELDERKIIFPRMRNKKVLNLFRNLRTKIIEKTDNKNFTLMVTSICENGGGTFVSTNLAASIALDQGKTSLMVDCNLYSPSDEYLIEGSEYGFSDFLENPTVSVEEIIYATGIPRMRMVPAGTATEIGPEYYTSYRMRTFIDEIRSRYADRYIVLDVPPIGSAADARILSEICDHVLIVVPYGMVTKDQIRAAVESVPAEKFLGLVFNN